MEYLTQKVIRGGSGVWGEVSMPAHPTLAKEDAQQIVSWVMSLSNTSAAKKSLPQTGTIIPPAAKAGAGPGLGQKPPPVLVLSASYTDKGGNNIKALTGNTSIALQSNTMSFAGDEKTSGFTTFRYSGNNLLLFPNGEGWFAKNNIDLTGVSSVNLISGWQTAPKSGYSFEVRLDAPDGRILGKGTTPAPQKGQQFGITHIELEKIEDGKFHVIYFVYKAQETITGGVVSVQFN
jgi:hypothetical protein